MFRRIEFKFAVRGYGKTEKEEKREDSERGEERRRGRGKEKEW